MGNNDKKSPIDLTGEDLFNFLSSQPTTSVSSTLGSHPYKKDDKTVAPGWLDIAVVLVVHVCTCKGCGAVLRIPNHYPLIKRSHLTHGTHYHSLKGIANPTALYDHLPMQIEELPDSMPTCEACFLSIDLNDLIPRKEENVETFTIDNPPTDKHRLHNRGK